MTPKIAVHVTDKRFYFKKLFLKKFCTKIVQLAWKDSYPDTEISVCLVGNDFIQNLNKIYRHKDCATNVLTFPMPQPRSGITWLAGDIVISYDTVLKEATEQKKTFLFHLAHMLIHGTLHLQGYDHIEIKEAQKMERKERVYLRSLFHS